MYSKSDIRVLEKEEIVLDLEKKYEELDPGKKDKLPKDKFYEIIKLIPKNENISRENSDVIFRGIDFNNQGYISKFDFLSYVKAELYNDELNQYKIIFRAFDKNKDGALTMDSIVEIGKFANKRLSKKEVELTLENETGSKNGKITFPVFYKMMTNYDIDPKSDPYDGRLKSSSLCCLLI